jgi:hypothetical protein
MPASTSRKKIAQEPVVLRNYNQREKPVDPFVTRATRQFDISHGVLAGFVIRCMVCNTKLSSPQEQCERLCTSCERRTRKGQDTSA